MLEVKKLTRAKAEKMIARTADEKTLRLFAQHQNKHVVKKAEYKLARLSVVAS